MPMTRPPAFLAPRLTASITPERPPVTTTAPRSASSFPTSSPARSARAGTGSLGVRALLPMTVMTGRRVTRSGEMPELRIESEIVEDHLRLFGGGPAPVRIELVLVPRVRERGRLLDRKDRRCRRLHLLAPLLGVLLRPEEMDGGSGEVDVLPEVARRHADLHDGPGLLVRAAVRVHLDDQLLAAVGAVRLDHTRLAQRGWDAERVPGADPEPDTTSGGDVEVGGLHAEGVVGVDLVRVLTWNEDAAFDEARERSVNGRDVLPHVRGHACDRWDLSAGLDRSRDGDADLAVEISLRHSRRTSRGRARSSGQDRRSACPPSPSRGGTQRTRGSRSR